VILKRLPVPAPKPISYKKAWIWLGVYFLLMSPTMQLGVVPFFSRISTGTVYCGRGIGFDGEYVLASAQTVHAAKQAPSRDADYNSVCAACCLVGAICWVVCPIHNLYACRGHLFTTVSPVAISIMIATYESSHPN
jgi:hypothetical protein